MSKLKLKKWTQIYPQNTPEGNEEQRFFAGKNRQSGLARHPKWTWRSTKALVQESGLSLERVEEIINKYYNLGMIVMSKAKPDHWGYWERDEVKAQILSEMNSKSIADDDKSSRINDHLE